MTALEMQIELKRLAVRHNIPTVEPFVAPLLEEVTGDIIVEGYPSSASTDLARTRFRRRCFALPATLPPLLYRHGEPAGEVLALHYDDDGQLFVRARVSHAAAKRCSHFSIGATVEKWQLCEVDDPKAFHGLITRCRIDEISITPSPCQPEAKIIRRYKPGPWDPFLKAKDQQHALTLRAIDTVQRMVQHLASIPAPPPPPPQRPFAQLVDQLNNRGMET